MNQPSSTITAATLAGLVMAALWAVANEFYFKPRGIVPSAEMASLVNAAVVGLVGYFKKENVLYSNRP